LVVVLPKILRDQPIPYFDGILMFPAMLIGPSVTGTVLTRVVDGKVGVQALVSRMRKTRASGKWYLAALFIFPILILSVLLILSWFVSSDYAPHILVYGIAFGILSGYLEEIGWTGYAFPKMNLKYGALQSALFLGAIWGLWHAPVVDFLGAAYPHGAYWLPFYLSFIALVMAVRVIIVWIYTNTGSVLLAQISHASSTSFLAFLGPLSVLPVQEASWYAVYAATLWMVVALIVFRYGKRLVRSIKSRPVSSHGRAPDSLT
jgi:membrane protease YdiL (CAAX protease family)